jgi:hypothetical protein
MQTRIRMARRGRLVEVLDDGATDWDIGGIAVFCEWVRLKFGVPEKKTCKRHLDKLVEGGHEARRILRIRSCHVSRRAGLASGTSIHAVDSFFYFYREEWARLRAAM